MKVGDRVVCIQAEPYYIGRQSPLINGREYIIYNINNCPKCNALELDVGFEDPCVVIESECYLCQYTETHNKKQIAWFGAYRFRKVEEQVNYVKLEVEIEEPCLN